MANPGEAAAPPREAEDPVGPGYLEAPEWFKKALAEPVREGVVEVGGCPIAYRSWGDASLPGLLLVHGGGAHSRWWDHVGPFFARECAVTALDLSGHGDSGRRPSYTFEAWAQEIATLAGMSEGDALPVVVAHSLGGLASLFAAARHGEAFEGVIAVDSPVRNPSPEQEASSNRQAFGPLKLYPTREAILERFHPVPEQPGCLPYVVEHIRAHSIRRVEGGWTWKFDPNFFADVGYLDDAVLAAVSCRVAVLRAENGLVTEDIGRHMYECLGRTAPVIEIPLAYHHVMLDQPIALVSAVRALLADWRHSYALRAPR